MTTQVYCDWLPLSAPMICGSAVDTTVLLSIATNSTSSRPLSASRTCRCDIGAGLDGAGTVKGRLREKWEREPQLRDPGTLFPLGKFSHRASFEGG